jgi:uncharacterized protein YyaL (SSP411 family)
MTTNALRDQTSPYLLQHADNPVHWQPWSPAAFERARNEDKPIFLSVGYSTCHWCHVMAHESFEDDVVAKVLNDHFVSIKVDREELPDVDAQYMLATQAFYMLMQNPRSGGWPNSVWLMPDGRPFYAGTYFPKPTFIELLTQLNRFWQDERAKVEQNAVAIGGLMERMSGLQVDESPSLSSSMLDRAVEQITQRFDTTHGGFGGRPKFPPHGAVALIVAQLERKPNDRLRRMLTATLGAMGRGGLYDHVGGGFHRYSTDERWFLPHFEKMLYDNAQLISAYTHGYRITHDRTCARVVAETFDWLSREMTDPHGGFYSALDADSEGVEGRFYVWAYDELVAVLGSERATAFAAAYGVKPGGNWTDEATGQAESTNVLSLTIPSRDDAALAQLAEDRARLLTARDQRIRPHLDDKVLASWNGLMIGALAEAGRTLGEEKYLDAAKEAGAFLQREMLGEEGELLRVYRNGVAHQLGYLDDYAYVVDAMITLHEVSREWTWLTFAKHLAGLMIGRFADEAEGGFYFTSTKHDMRITRSKNPHAGGNMPDPNGVAARVLLRLDAIEPNERYASQARRTLELFAAQMNEQPHGSEELLIAAMIYLDGPHNEAEEEGPVTTCGIGPIRVKGVLPDRQVVAGGQTDVALTIAIEPSYHIYANDVGDTQVAAHAHHQRRLRSDHAWPNHMADANSDQ